MKSNRGTTLGAYLEKQTCLSCKQRGHDSRGKPGTIIRARYILKKKFWPSCIWRTLRLSITLPASRARKQENLWLPLVKISVWPGKTAQPKRCQRWTAGPTSHWAHISKKQQSDEVNRQHTGAGKCGGALLGQAPNWKPFTMFAFLPDNTKSWTVWLPFQIRENWDSEKLTHFPKVREAMRETSLLKVYVTPPSHCTTQDPEMKGSMGREV